jgi:hypothetical protein
MNQGYFAGVYAGVYAGLTRKTRDGRVVAVRRIPPTFRRQWYLVTPGLTAPFEQRVKRGHIASICIVAVGVQFFRDPLVLRILWAIAAFGLIVAPAIQAWIMHPLPAISVQPSELEPVDRRAQRLAFARATGQPTLAALFGLGLLLIVPQLYVAVTDGAWWAWSGVAIFSGCAGYFGWALLRLRSETGVHQ